MSIKFHHETLDFIKYILPAIIFMVSSFPVMDYVGLEKNECHPVFESQRKIHSLILNAEFVGRYSLKD